MTAKMFDGEFLDVLGFRLEVARFGPRDPDGPTLVFLHEGLGCVALWKGFPKQVAERLGVGVVAYSRAGYGKSDPVPLPRPLTYMHEEGQTVLPALLDALGLTDVILVGHSDGGSIALIHAGDAGPEDRRVKGVVTLAAHVFNEEVCVASIREAKAVYENGGLRDGLERYHGDNVDTAFWGWNGAWLHPDFMQWNIEEFLPGIAVPVLAIQGEDDEYGTLAQVDAICGQVSGPSERLIIKSCRHSPHRDQPEQTIGAIGRFAAAVWPDLPTQNG